MAELPTGTVTFLFTDIEGSTRLWEDHQDAMKDALARHDAILRGSVEATTAWCSRRWVTASRPRSRSAPDAVKAVLDAQQRLGAESWGDDGPAAGADGSAHR